MRKILAAGSLCILTVLSCALRAEKAGVVKVNVLGLRKEPDAQSKIVTVLKWGEELILLKIPAKYKNKADISDWCFVKVKTSGEKGWVKKKYIEIGAKPAVVIKKAEIFDRPHLLASTGKTIPSMTLILVTDSKKDEEGNLWVKYVRKYSKRTANIKSKGWIKKDCISENLKEVAAAKRLDEARERLDQGQKEEAIKLLESVVKDFPTTVAASYAQQEYAQLMGESSATEGAIEEIETQEQPQNQQSTEESTAVEE